jgi:hypothetical protein
MVRSRSVGVDNCLGRGKASEAGLGRRNDATMDERRSEGRPKNLTYGWMGRIRNQFSLFK